MFCQSLSQLVGILGTRTWGCKSTPLCVAIEPLRSVPSKMRSFYLPLRSENLRINACCGDASVYYGK